MYGKEIEHQSERENELERDREKETLRINEKEIPPGLTMTEKRHQIVTWKLFQLNYQTSG
jgi:hypothetical protein